MQKLHTKFHNIKDGFPFQQMPESSALLTAESKSRLTRRHSHARLAHVGAGGLSPALCSLLDA